MEWAANRMESLGDFPLLTTKLQVTRPPANLVHRERLYERLNDGVRGKLVLVTAPTGFGKTTLLSAWAALDGRNVAWLSLDTSDNPPVRFWAYVLGAIRQVQPGLGVATMQALRAGEPIEFALAPLLNELAAVAGNVVLILDDYHTITDPSTHASLDFFIERMPPQAHLAISSRTQPPLQTSRLRGRGELLEIREPELRFSSADATALLELVAGREIAPDEREGLAALSEGWAVGLQLAALSRRDAAGSEPRDEGCADRYPYVADYVLLELLQRVPEPGRSTLLQLSVPALFNADLVGAVTGAEDPDRLLRAIAADAFFVIPSEAGQGWYRLHRLVRTVLRERLRCEQPALEKAVHERAAEWFEAHGMVREAVRHRAASGANADAARLAERCAELLLAERDLPTLLEWSDAIEAEQVHRRPKLALAFAWAALLSGRQERAAGFMAMARNAAPLPLMDGLADVRGHLTALENALRVGADPGLEHEVPATHRPVNGGRPLRTASTGTAPMGSLPTNTLERDGATAGRFSLAEALPRIGMLQIRQGKLSAAETTFLKAMDLFESEGDVEGFDTQHAWAAALCAIGRARVAYERDRMAGAMELVREGLQHGRSVARRDIIRDGFLLLARIHEARGDLDGALDAVTEAETELRAIGPTDADRAALGACRARVMLAKGELEEATAWSRRHRLEPIAEGPDGDEDQRLVHARVRIALHRTDEALDVLAPLIRHAEARDLADTLIHGSLLQAIAYDLAGEAELSALVAQRALALAEPEGYVRAFTSEGPAAARLLKRVRGQQESGELAPTVSTEYIRELLAALGEGRPAGDDAHENGLRSGRALPPLLTPISDREIEVLRLIADGKSNASIADSLYISVSTVKTHINNLYSKLGVESRTQALARAKEYNLL